jgi:hypothetical protein
VTPGLVGFIRRVARGYARWHWVDDPAGLGEIDIAPLVSPLRYDIVTKREFVAFYEAHRDLYSTAIAEFMELARSQPYYVFLQKVRAVRKGQELVTNPAALHRVVSNRIKQFITLHTSMVRKGFDRSYPIEVRISGRTLPTLTGKRVLTPYTLGDGGHRLACLLAMGYTTLSPGCYRVRWFRDVVPADNTAPLAGLLPIHEAAYAAYLSSFYTPLTRHERLADLVADVRATRPALAGDLEALIAIDGFTVVPTERPARAGIGAEE